MYQSRVSRLRLAAAVAVAVTAGAVVPASAVTPAAAPTGVTVATGTAETPAGTREVAAIAPDSEVVSAGTTGFLSADADGGLSWTRHSDGSSTRIGRDQAQFAPTPGHGAVSDVVATGDSGIPAGYRTVTLRDMAYASTPEQVHLGPDRRYAGLVGSTVVTTSGDLTSAQRVHLTTRDAEGRRTDTTVTGLPSGAHRVTVSAAEPGSVLLQYSTGTNGDRLWHLALVDLAAGTVTENHTVGAGIAEATAVSGTHVVWIDKLDGFGKAELAVAPRGSGKVTRTELPELHRPLLGLVGGWAAYGDETELIHGEADNPSMALRAVPLSGGTARALLDHVTSVTPAPDGALLAMGGTVEKDEGVYRISPGTDGAPVAELVASTGEPTEVTVLGHNVPAVIDLDRDGGRVPLEWRLSRLNVEMTVTLTHTRTGRSSTAYLYPDNGDSPGPQRAGYTWDGDLGMDLSAYNGEYTWQVGARPRNGVGPVATASGTFRVTRAPAPHDYTDNGSPDLLARDADGRLWREDTHWNHLNQAVFGPRRNLVGSGWGAYDRIEAAGDLGGSPTADLVARDRTGVLWLYQGRGDGTFAARVKVGGGWQAYPRLTGGGDLTGDGRADLVAADGAGVLWLYRGTGNTAAPFAARTRIGTGWQVYDRLTATGDIAGTAAGDLVARDTTGVLWLYQGRGDGTFAARVRIGGGWNAYTHLVGAGDLNRDGRADVYGFGPEARSYAYFATGDATAPFRAGVPLTALHEGRQTYDHVG